MESLYRKYRPQTFADVVGQKHVVGTLQNAVLEGRVSHAYLFCGPRGTGKTTMARLLAKALMCDEGEGKLPDGTCEQCLAIAAGTHPDVYELDAASRTGVDNVREEIITRVDYAPVMGRYKMYIIDEVHMLTTAAFNALLKTLEEPPAHVVFVLCTTDPERVPATIQSRVQRFDFRSLAFGEIKQHLMQVCAQEGFAAEPEAIELICRHARGGMRDALSDLEQIAVYGANRISVEATQEVLGESSGSMIGAFTLALASRDSAALFENTAALAGSGKDILQFTRDLAAHIRDVYVVSAVGAKQGVVAAEGDALTQLQAEAQAFGSTERVAHALTVLGDTALAMRTSPDQRLLLEIALTKIARPEFDLTLEALASRISTLEAGSAAVAPVAVVAPVTETTDAAAPVAAPVSAPAAAATLTPAPASEPAPTPKATTTPVPTPASASEPASVDTPTPAPEPAPDPAPSAVSSGDLRAKWQQVVDRLCAESSQYGALVLNASAAEDDGERLTINLPLNSSFAMRMLDRKDVRETMMPIVEDIFGHRMLVYREAEIEKSSALASEVEVEVEAPAPAAEQVQEVEAEAPAPEVSTSVSFVETIDAPFEGGYFVEDAPTVDITPEPTPIPVATPEAATENTSEPEPEPEPESSIPQNLTSMLEDVFGKGVSVTTVSPVEEPPVEEIASENDYSLSTNDSSDVNAELGGDFASGFDTGLDASIDELDALTGNDDYDSFDEND